MSRWAMTWGELDQALISPAYGSTQTDLMQVRRAATRRGLARDAHKTMAFWRVTASALSGGKEDYSEGQRLRGLGFSLCAKSGE
jgi:hypothetical protein